MSASPAIPSTDRSPRNLADLPPGWYNGGKTGAGREPDARLLSWEESIPPMRVLVVDDDPPSVKMKSFLLQEEG